MPHRKSAFALTVMSPKPSFEIVTVNMTQTPVRRQQGRGADTRERRQTPLAMHVEIHLRDPVGQRHCVDVMTM
jgi:hypothetical protein